MKNQFKNLLILAIFARIMSLVYLLFAVPAWLIAQPKLIPKSPDFQVNENAGFCDQNNTDVGIDSAGNMVVVWEDARNGNWDIYGQRYSAAGIALGGNFKINADPNNRRNHHNPSVAIALDGHFIVVWQHAEHDAIYGQIYDAQGQAVGGNFQVDDPSVRQGQVTYPEISLNQTTGEFVVVWDYFHHATQHDVYAQRFTGNGQKLGAPIQVNPGTVARYPSVSLNAAGDWIVVWQDERADAGDIYGQRFDAADHPVGADFKIDDQIQYKAASPIVGMAADGGWVVIWQDYREGNHLDIHIYGQRYNNQGQALGANFRIGGAEDTRNCDLVVADAGNFAVVYQQAADVYLQRFDTNGQPVGSANLVVDLAAQSFGQYNPHLALNSQGQLATAWEDRRQGNYDIFSQRFSPAGEMVGVNFQVNDDPPGSATSNQPDIAGREDYGFWVTWVDPRNNHLDLYAQRYDRNHTPVGENFKVNDDLAVASQKEATIGMDDAGNVVMVWRDYRNPTAIADIYGQRYDRNGQRLGANFRVNDDPVDDPERYGQFGPALAVSADGSFVVCWHDQRLRHSGRAWVIYGQRYDAAGTPLGGNFQISDDTRASSKFWSKIAADSAGNFVVVWQDTLTTGGRDIFGQRFAANGQRLGTNFQINSPGANNRCQWPDVSFGAHGDFLVVWIEGNAANADLYRRHFQADGTPTGAPVKVNDNLQSSTRNFPRLGWTQFYHYFNVVWQDDRNGNLDIYAQLLDSAGNPLGANYRVNQDPGTNYQIDAKVAFSERFLYYTWEDTRTAGQGRDIYARVDVLNSPPAVPKLLTPDHQAYLNVVVPQLSFEIPADPDHNELLNFIVEVSTDSQFSNYTPGGYFDSQSDTSGFSLDPPYQQGSGVCRFTVVTDPPQWPDPIPLAEGTYYWRVTAKDDFEKSQPSEIRQFTVDRTPPQNVQLALLDPQYPPDWYQPDSVKEIVAAVRYDENNPQQLVLEIAGLDTLVVTENLPGGANQQVLISIPVAGAKDGVYEVKSRVIDQVGSWRASNPDSFQLDRTPPRGTRATAIDTSRQLEFQVDWGGASDSNGVGLSGQYDVNVRDDGGNWQNWRRHFTGTQATFTGEYGHTYEFEAAARDFLGNTEPFTGVAETRTAVLLPLDFSLKIIPDSVAMLAGDTVSVTITITPQGGFNEWVTLWIQDLPPNIQAKFDPKEIQPGSQSRLTVQTSAQTPVGTYSLLITGAADTLQHRQPLVLQVGAAPDFELVVQPDSTEVRAGDQVITEISLLAKGGFDQAVTLDVLNLPTGAQAKFDPNPIRPGSQSRLTVQTSAQTPVGTYSLLITGAADTLQHRQPLVLQVGAAPDFELVVQPDSAAIFAGETQSIRIAIRPDPDFADSVKLSVTDLPEFSRATFSQNPIWPDTTATLRIGTDRLSPAGLYQLRISGSTTTFSHEKIFGLRINPRLDFQLRTTPDTAQIHAGQTAYFTIELQAAPQFDQLVTLNLAGIPTGAQATFSPKSIDRQTSSRLTLETSRTVLPGSYALVILGQSDALSAQDTVLLVILPSGDFKLQLEPTQVQLVAGASVGIQVSIRPENEFSESVSLAISDLPAATSASFNPVSIRPGQVSQLTLVTSPGTPPGSYQVQFTGTAGELRREAILLLEILAAPDFLIQVSPETLHVKAGESVTCQVQILPVNQFDETVTLSLTGNPAGVNGTFLPARISALTPAMLTLSTVTYLNSGQFELQIQGISSHQLNRTASLMLEIQGFHAGATPNPFTPNGDGFNDFVLFNLMELHSGAGEVNIFNFRGKKVITLQQNFRWDGKNEGGEAQPPGVYLYIAKADGKIIDKGAITLIR